MKRIESRVMGIDEGEVVLFSDFETGGVMWTGEGVRTCRQSVRFSERFRAFPAVHCALSMWDIDSRTNARIEISADKITPDGFDIVFRTWADSRIARARVRWMAIGAVTSQDDWDLY